MKTRALIVAAVLLATLASASVTAAARPSALAVRDAKVLSVTSSGPAHTTVDRVTFNTKTGVITADVTQHCFEWYYVADEGVVDGPFLSAPVYVEGWASQGKAARYDLVSGACDTPLQMSFVWTTDEQLSEEGGLKRGPATLDLVSVQSASPLVFMEIHVEVQL